MSSNSTPIPVSCKLLEEQDDNWIFGDLSLESSSFEEDEAAKPSNEVW